MVLIVSRNTKSQVVGVAHKVPTASMGAKFNYTLQPRVVIIEAKIDRVSSRLIA